MRTVSAAMTSRWLNQAKAGGQRPVVRATIQKVNLQRFDYDTANAPGGDFAETRHRKGVTTSVIFGHGAPVREIRTIKQYSWTRSVDQDVATCTLTLMNSDLAPIGNATEAGHASDFDLPGFFTYNRGEAAMSANRWGYSTETGWQNVFVPDRLVKTYEGYGSDPSLPPARDPNLVQSGTWLIDKVDYTANGEITLQMRDVGRLLLDQIVFPPVVPYAEYPLIWEKIHTENVPGRDARGGSWLYPTLAIGATSSSNGAYVGKGLTNPPLPHYVTSDGGVNGHHPNHALVRKEGEFWLSTGQETPESKVWWQFTFDTARPVAGVRIRPHGGPYRIYISLKTANGWIGKRKIPYKATTGGVNVGAGVPFVETMLADRRFPFDVILRRKYANVTAVRLTFTKLMDTRVGAYPFRAGLREMAVYTADTVAALSFGRGNFLKVVGNYSDYSDIVKWACVWGGFFWPNNNTGQDYVMLTYKNDTDPQGGKKTISFALDDPKLPKGRVWGNFMNSGTAALAPLTVELFDKKPLMDIINYVRDVLGFIFFVDEAGGVVWRMPNIFSAGNWLSPGALEPRSRTRVAETVTIDEEQTLLDYSTTLNSENIRERIFIANTTGKIGIVIRGYRPTFQGQGFRRVAGWTDQRFETKNETRIMADLVAARQMFTYRTAKTVIPGYPKIQVDDQIRIFERVTNETFYHYVVGITSDLDMEEGTWTYTLDSHWLGEDPNEAWVVKPTELASVTQAYLNTLGTGDS